MKTARNAGQRKRCRNNGDERNIAVHNKIVQLQNSYEEPQANRSQPCSRRSTSCSLPRVFIFFTFSFFLNAAIHLSFAPSIPPSFPVCPLLWVTDTQGKMCVCCCVQAGCYCHQEQSHLLPNTWCAMDQETGQKPPPHPKKNISSASTAQCTLLFSCTKTQKSESFTYYYK